MKKWIASKSFYKSVLYIALPMMLQQGLTAFVGLLDNLMVGSLGTEQISGVAIANQLMFVFYLCIFGSIAGASIFSAQFFGAKDIEGIRSCFRFKLIVAIVVAIIAGGIFYLFHESLIQLFITESSEQDGDPMNILSHGKDYLMIMLFSLIPFAIVQVYSTTLRETKKTILPMVCGIIALFLNLGLNYILIFGHLGFPELGVIGAAIATLIARFFEMGSLIIYSHFHANKYPFIKRIYTTLRVPKVLVGKIFGRGLPLFANEVMWSVGMTTLFQIYSLRGINVVAAFNISSTISQLFFVAFLALGNASAIIIGQLLGAGKNADAKDASRYLLVFTVFICTIISFGLFGASFIIPYMYNVSDAIRLLAQQFMIIVAIFLPIFAFNVQIYFTLRAGGVSYITFLFDSGFIWMVAVPVALVLVKLTGISIIIVYIAVQLSDLVKTVLGYWLLKTGIWLKNLVDEPKLQSA